MNGLIYSRKFWLLILDTIISLVVLMGGWWLSPQDIDKVMAVIAILQPVFVFVINGITREDVAKLEAGVHITQQKG